MPTLINLSSWAIPLWGRGHQCRPPTPQYRQRFVLRITYKSSTSSYSHPSNPPGPESLLTPPYVEMHLCPTPLTSQSPGLPFLPPACSPLSRPFLPAQANSVSSRIASRVLGLPTLSNGPEGGPHQAISIPELSLTLEQDGGPRPQGASECGSPCVPSPGFTRGR